MHYSIFTASSIHYNYILQHNCSLFGTAKRKIKTDYYRYKVYARTIPLTNRWQQCSKVGKEKECKRVNADVNKNKNNTFLGKSALQMFSGGRELRGENSDNKSGAENKT